MVGCGLAIEPRPPPPTHTYTRFGRFFLGGPEREGAPFLSVLVAIHTNGLDFAGPNRFWNSLNGVVRALKDDGVLPFIELDLDGGLNFGDGLSYEYLGPWLGVYREFSLSGSKRDGLVLSTSNSNPFS